MEDLKVWEYFFYTRWLSFPKNCVIKWRVVLFFFNQFILRPNLPRRSLKLIYARTIEKAILLLRGGYITSLSLHIYPIYMFTRIYEFWTFDDFQNPESSAADTLATEKILFPKHFEWNTIFKRQVRSSNICTVVQYLHVITIRFSRILRLWLKCLSRR